MLEPTSRRSLLKHAAIGAAALALPLRSARAGNRRPKLEVGEGVVDTTPPLGIEMAGFHRPAGKERRIKGIRQSTAARALMLRHGSVQDAQAVVVSLDICGVSRAMTTRIQTRIARKTGIPAANIRICATHTHSMPTFRYFRQWGAISPEYMASVEQKILQAVELAKADLAETDLHLGKSRAQGASNNRTTKTWKTDEQFDKNSTDSQRWLDTMVHVLHFERGKNKRNLLWYHFSAHPVCFRDDKAGPDWPGVLDELVRQDLKITPSLLQGHCGDVNAGDAAHWIGAAENTASPVAAAIEKAVHTARSVNVDRLRMRTQQMALPLDMKLFAKWLTEYRADPTKCNTGPWVDAGFSADWFQSSAKRNMNEQSIRIPVSVAQLGEIGFVFHPSELYSCYGLTIRRDSPLADTLVVGYADDIIGYLPDPTAYKAGEYSAITVPKIIDLPPFLPTAGRTMARAAVRMLQEVVA